MQYIQIEIYLTLHTKVAKLLLSKHLFRTLNRNRRFEVIYIFCGFDYSRVITIKRFLNPFACLLYNMQQLDTLLSNLYNNMRLRIFKHINKRKRKKIEVPQTDNLEIAISLADLVALSLDSEIYDRFFIHVFRLTETTSPFHGFTYDDSYKIGFDALSVIRRLTEDYCLEQSCLEQAEESTLPEFKDKLLEKVSEYFGRLKRSYRSLDIEDAKQFVNKPLGFIRDYPLALLSASSSTDMPLKELSLVGIPSDDVPSDYTRLKDLSPRELHLREFVSSANTTLFPQNSRIWANGNWSLCSESVEGDIALRTEFIEETINKKLAKFNMGGKRIGEIREILESETRVYQEELLRRIRTPDLQRLLADEPFNIHDVGDVANENNTNMYNATGASTCEASQLIALAHIIVMSGALILPKPSTITSHSEKDLNDLVEYQFPDDKQYLIEEVSNSRDAKASHVMFRFYQNGLTIEDDGIGMTPEFFFKKYPLPYITLKNGRVKIGRFGVGAKAKLVEVVKHNGEVYVETRTEDRKAEDGNIKDRITEDNNSFIKSKGDHCLLRQRYFLHNGRLYVGFSQLQPAQNQGEQQQVQHQSVQHQSNPSQSSQQQRGVKITIISEDYCGKDDAKIKEKKSHLADKLEYVNPNFEVIVDGKRINASNILTRDNTQNNTQGKTQDNPNISTIKYLGELEKVYFEILKEKEQHKGKLVFLSGENKICTVPAPFFGVIEIPLQFQPVEGRDDFVYTPELRQYFAMIFEEAMLPRLVDGYKAHTNASVHDAIEACARWFLDKKHHQNPFAYFEQFAIRQKFVDFYKLLCQEKEIGDDSMIVASAGGIYRKLNQIIPNDLFVPRRESSPSYVISLDDYIRYSYLRHTHPQKDKATKYAEDLMAQLFASQRVNFKINNSCVCLDGRPIMLLYLPQINHDNPFYFDRTNRMLVVNTSHASFALREPRRSFYLAEMLRIAENE